MKRTLTIFLLFFTLQHSFGQIQKKTITCLSVQYNKTIYDKTIGNNPWGTGIGLQTIINNKTKFKPTIEVTADIYLEDDKVFRTNPDETEIGDVRGMVNLFAGTSFHPAQTIYLSFIAGPSFIGGQILLGVKPSLGFYFSKSQKWAGKISYINIFNRHKTTNGDFGSLSLGIALKLF